MRRPLPFHNPLLPDCSAFAVSDRAERSEAYLLRERRPKRRRKRTGHPMEPARVRAIDVGIWAIDALLAPQECCALVECASRVGFADAQPHFRGRHNAEAFVENASLATHLEVELLSCGLRVELDDLLEIYRYHAGQHITAHTDAGRPIRHHCQSDFTLLIYLSDDFRGGRTIFTGRGAAVAPSVGGALLFEHGVLHAAEAVSAGVKYVARIDAHVSRFADPVLRTDEPSRGSV